MATPCSSFCGLLHLAVLVLMGVPLVNADISHTLACSSTCDGSEQSAVRWNNPGVSCTIDTSGELVIPRTGGRVDVPLPDLEAGAL